MKPIKLTLEAFGTFAQKTEIDFHELGNDGIFLISGETGSGKTTIFDAICYAIYGEANGQDREAKYFRSQFAEPTQETYVTLVFEYLGKKYEIGRNPEYSKQRILKNGELKVTTKSADVYLIYPDGSVIKKDKEVKKAIESIIGLNCNQFRQIVMIAQGEFKRFLLSKSDDKGAILNTVFGTQKFVNFIEAINNKKDILKKDYLNSLNSIINDVLSIRYDNDWDYAPQFEEWKSLKNEDKDIEMVLPKFKEYIDMLSEEISKDEISLKDISLQYDTLSKKINSIKTINTNINKRDKLIFDLENLSKQENDINQVRSTLDRLNVAKSIEINYLNYKKSYEAIQNLKYQLDELNHNLKICTGNIANLSKKKSQISLKLLEYKKDISSNADVSIELNNLIKDLSIQKEDITKQGLEVKNILNDIQVYNSELSKLEILKLDFANKTNTKAQQENDYIENERRYNLNIAGVLAEQLKDNIPCMVCGSVNHPQKASKCEDAPSKEELQNLKNRLEEYRDIYNQSYNNFLLQQNNCEHLKADIFKKVEKFNIFSRDIQDIQVQLNSLRDTLITDYKSMEDKLKSIQKDIHDLNIIEENLNRYKSQHISLDTSIKDKTTQLEENSLEYITLKEDYFKLLQEKSIESETVHLDLLRKYSQYDTLSNRVQTFEKSKLDYSIRLSEYSKMVGDNVKVDTSSLENELYKKQQVRDTLIQRCSLIKNMIDNNYIIYSKVSKNIKSIAEKRKKYLDTEYLYKVASGKNVNSSEKIAFDNYVQAYYFEKVIHCANQKINIMSNGRYSLIRKEHGTSKKVRGGLDIEVRDAYTGMTRLASTLSGGETFMASLSLALGLSEVVQQHSGGIKIDAMFIDEGFGTLDSNLSLQQAIKVLDSLAVNNRIVGIISHVGELQEHIPRKLYVEKSQGGSRVRIS